MITKNDLATTKGVVCYYSRGLGGKTILNVLGFSNEFLLQDLQVSKDQLSSKEKFELIISRLKQDKFVSLNQYWNDIRDDSWLEIPQKQSRNIIGCHCQYKMK